MKDRGVKREAREDKRDWTELYRTAKKITNKRRHQVATVKIKRSDIIIGKNARLERLAERFEKVLVRKASMNPIEENEVESDEISEMDTTKIKEPDVRQALKKTNTGRTPGIDGIPSVQNK